MGIFEFILLSFLMLLAVAVVFMRDLLAAAVVFAVYSLIMAIVFTRLKAPDVALTEAAVGAGITTLLFIVSIAKTIRREEDD
ncbi:MAG TPA: hydrogenase subunit MbhD domain-containing protein [Atribacteraceae bacterium]|nr:hydrogenase subunit MbhD domain-containing protein [Atribacteraceae bacterium]